MPMRISVIFCVPFFFCLMAVHAQDLAHLKDQGPVTFHGNISTGLNYYADLSKGGDSLSKPSFGHSPSYFIQADPVLSLYGFPIPINIMIASRNKSFNTPFNRFGMSPYYKWAKLHLGWRSLNFSQFTLSGQQMLGAGFELTPGKFRVAFMYGKFNNAITDISLYNNLNSNVPVFKRKGFAAKIGYGTGKNFVEFSYLQAKDHSGSLNNVGLDTLLVKPAANQVAGIKGKVTVAERLTFEAEAAVSYYTRDIMAQLLDLDPPLKELASVPPRTTSQLAVAGEANLRYTFKNGNASVGYRRVDPDYTSMGTFYMQTDVEQYVAGLALAFWKHKINLQSRFGWQKNNLSHTSATKGNRIIGNANISFNPKPNMGVDVQYSNYGISQQVIPQLRDPATLVRYDSVRISQVNQSISISPHLLIVGKSLQHSMSLQAGRQSLKNFNEKHKGGDFTSTSASLIYALLFPERKINITNVINYFNTALTANKTELMGYNLAVGKILKGHLRTGKSFISSITLSLNSGYFINRMNGASTGNTIMLNPSVSLAFLKRNSLQLMANYTSTDNRNTSGNNRNFMMAARYNLSF